MPPAKRRSGSSGGQIGRPKKVKIGDETVIGDGTGATVSTTAASGRPKRESVGESRYNFSGRKLTATSRKAVNGKPVKSSLRTSGSATSALPERKRDRPAAGGATVKQEKKNKTSAPPVRPTKKVRRPRKSDISGSVPIRPGSSPPVPQECLDENCPRWVTDATKDAVTPLGRGRGQGAPPPSAKRGRGRPKGTKIVLTSDVNYVPKEPSVDDAFNDEDSTSEFSVGNDDGDRDRQYWLMKAEPDSRIVNGIDVKFSIDDLMNSDKPEPWDGVRNYVARNHMRAMRKGDLAFFYHSNCTVPGVVGIMKIVQEHSVDPSQFDQAHPYFDPKSDPAKPKWDYVHVGFVRKFNHMVDLKQLKARATEDGPLKQMAMLRQSRLSVSPVTRREWEVILDMAGEKDVSETELVADE